MHKKTGIPGRFFPTGKLPQELLAELLSGLAAGDQTVLVGPGVGLDCAVVELGEQYLVLKSDPITFASDEIGWYAVQINANDVATCGAQPRWFMATLLLPQEKTSIELVRAIMDQIENACRGMKVTLVGGHTEITSGLERPIVVGTMVGVVSREALVTPLGASPGDRLLLTKGVPLEAVSILAREFPERLEGVLTQKELEQARMYLHDPGISVLLDAQVATGAGGVTAMHDPTEGGLAAALWELAHASGCRVEFEPSAVPVPHLAQRVCRHFELDPLAAIASGALLISAAPERSVAICQALEQHGILCAEIGRLTEGQPQVFSRTPVGVELLALPERDEIARLFDLV